jgi:hypothetical protein
MVTPLPPPAELGRVGPATLAMALAHDGPALGADEVGPASGFATLVGPSGRRIFVRGRWKVDDSVVLAPSAASRFRVEHRS